MNKNSTNYAQMNLSQVGNELKENEKYEAFLIPTKTLEVCKQSANLNNSNVNEINYNILEDASDSGVNCLDSESSEIFVGSFGSQNEFDLDNNTCSKDTFFGNDFIKIKSENFYDKNPNNQTDFNIITNREIFLEQNDKIDNECEKNHEIIRLNNATNNNSNIESGNIIYRNKTKNSTIAKAPKKRVSFHEDILKNTRTDNIHIEHGFITYKNSKKINVPGRHSWCFNVDSNKSSCEEELTCRCSSCEKQIRSVAYRNACSDVLDYGNANIYENLESFGLELTNPNAFEKEDKIFHSNSNPNFHSADNLIYVEQLSNSKNSHEYPKSSSCDCIGFCPTNSYLISKYCYFSEPSIEDPLQKSVCSKKKKKNSCLKKSLQKNAFSVDEDDVIKKMQRFNMHELKIFDKSKMIFGTFKNIFSTDLPERGIPEGLENAKTVCEYAKESDIVNRKFQGKVTATRLKKLSKSLDGEKNNNDNIAGCQNKFIHNVDEHLRKKEVNYESVICESNICYQSKQKVEDCALENFINDQEKINIAVKEESAQKYIQQTYRNKYIINCVSTVFEHTGVSVTDEINTDKSMKTTNIDELDKKIMDIKPLSNVFVNIFKSIKESVSPISTQKQNSMDKFEVSDRDLTYKKNYKENVTNISFKNECFNSSNVLKPKYFSSLCQNGNSDEWQNIQREGSTLSRNKIKTKNKKSQINSRSVRMTPDLFDCFRHDLGNLNVILFNDENDSRLKICHKSTDRNSMDVVTPRYFNTIKNEAYPTTAFSSNSINLSLNGFLKASQSVLINRFLHDVSKNKVIESSIRNNMVFANKIKQYKTFAGSLYIKGVKPLNQELIEDLNANIEMELSRGSFHYGDLITTSKSNISKTLIDIARFKLGIGEVPAEIFDGNCLHLLNNKNESLMKVFKLYAGYSKEGFMTPVLVFLTDKALYVRDLVENRLCNRYILKYSELDVILIGPYGNTVLLSNVSRDMQKVLLAGGPHTADGFVANLELCIRRGGFSLPAVGQLTLQNFASLQAFVRQNLFLSSTDNWVYYAVINSSAETLVSKDFFGANIRGFFMYRRFQENYVHKKEIWNTGFFLLRTDVLYMFNDTKQQFPTWMMQLSECQSTQRTENADRPHCFEIVFKHGLLQLAAPDDHVVVEWLQALNKVEKGVFEMHKKIKNLGCTLLMTTNHLVTLRENFTSPLGFRTLKLKNQDPKTFDDVIKENLKSRDLDTKADLIENSNNCLRSTFFKDSVPSRSNVNAKLVPLDKMKGKNYFIQENVNNLYAENAEIEVLTCAFIKEMTGVRIPSKFESWWCILEFSCQGAGETLKDLVIFFSSSSEMQRFLRILEQLWLAKNIDLFPLTILDEDDIISKQCTNVFINISRSWIPLLTAALTYPA